MTTRQLERKHTPKPRRVLFRIRKDVDRFPGGDMLHLEHTASALEAEGVECVIAPGVDPVPGMFDIVHLFNTTRVHEPWLQMKQARQLGQKVVLTPIWHSLADMKTAYQRLYHLPFFSIRAYLGLKEAFYAKRTKLPVLPRATVRFSKLQAELISDADVITPNSQAELETIIRESGARPKASVITPLGFTAFAPNASPELKRGRDVVVAGRIEPRKNQLLIVRAFKQLPRDGRRLLLYGASNETHQQYFDKVMREVVDGWVEYRGAVPQETLFAAYRSAGVAILASYFETFGLSALEGMAAGANVIVSDNYYNRAIYTDRVTFCDPFSLHSVRAAIVEASNKLTRDHSDFLNALTWKQTALRTLEAYSMALNA